MTGPRVSRQDRETDGETVAVVTGAARGIGAATATHLATRASVVVVDRTESDTADTVAAIRAAGGTALGLGCDVAAADQVATAVRQVIDTFGHVDVLVNCAGVNQDRLLLTMSDDEWDTVVDVNLGGSMRWSLAVGQHMKQRQRGRIILFSSVAASGNAGQTNYATAKAAISGFTRTLAAEFGVHGITVNAVAPGFVMTPMVDDLAQRLGVELSTFLSEAAARSAVGRVGSVEDIASTVAFLAGPESGYLTGQTICVDGGRR
jgi:novobiocin biosynthesis protein NovJ